MPGRSTGWTEESIGQESQLRVVFIETSILRPAPWNFKSEGSPAIIQKLAESIKEDSSAGVLAVREMEDGTFEVIDGNHRLKAIKEVLGWQSAWCENFGKIPKSKAMMIAAKRNADWFDFEMVSLGKAFKEIQESDRRTITDLAKVLPMSEAKINSVLEVADFKWDDLPEPAWSKGVNRDTQSLTIKLNLFVYSKWQQWIAKVKASDNESAFAQLLLSALGGDDGTNENESDA